MIGVVGLDHHREPDVARRLGGAILRGDEFLPRHREAEAGEDLVGFLLVACELDGDVRRLAGDGGLHPPLIAAVPQLYEAVASHPEPGYAALGGGLHQRGGAGSQRMPLGEADEIVALGGKVKTVRHASWRAEVGRQQAFEEGQSQRAGLESHLALLVLIHDPVVASRAE